MYYGIRKIKKGGKTMEQQELKRIAKEVVNRLGTIDDLNQSDLKNETRREYILSELQAIEMLMFEIIDNVN